MEAGAGADGGGEAAEGDGEGGGEVERSEGETTRLGEGEDEGAVVDAGAAREVEPVEKRVAKTDHRQEKLAASDGERPPVAGLEEEEEGADEAP